MNNERIYFTTPKGEYSIPNRWELLTPDEYLHLCHEIAKFAAEKATQYDVRLHFVCKMLGVNLNKIEDEDAMANLIILSEHIDFIFDTSTSLSASSQNSADALSARRQKPLSTIQFPL